MVSRRRVSRIAQIAGGGLLAFTLLFAAACGDDGDGNGIDLPDMDNGTNSDTLPGDNGGTGVNPLTPAPGDSGPDSDTLPGDGPDGGTDTLPGDGGAGGGGAGGGGSTP